MTEKQIHKILTSCAEHCKLHRAFDRALKPFVIIDPKEKAKDIIKAMKKGG